MLYTEIIKEIKNLILGDLSKIDQLQSLSHKEIQQAVSNEGLPTLSQQTTIKVLNDFSKGLISQTAIQRWALLILRGIWGTWENLDKQNNESNLNISSIEIPIEKKFEDKIIDTLNRLDELGDAVEGKLETKELQKLIDELKS